MSQEFGQKQSAYLIEDLVLQELSDLTASRALHEGIDPGEVWRAICIQLSVPKSRWQGHPIKPRE